MAGIYDQLTIFGANANPELTGEICEYIDIPAGRCDVFKFSNENIFPKPSIWTPDDHARGTLQP